MTVHSPLVKKLRPENLTFSVKFRARYFFSFWFYYITILSLESNFQNGFQNLTYSFKFSKCSSLRVRICGYEILPKVTRVRKIWHFLSNFRSSPILNLLKSQLAAHSLSSLQLGYMPARRRCRRENLTYHVKFSSAWNF